MIDISRLTEHLKTRRVGRRLEYAADVTSTNDVAWSMAGDPDADGLVVLADHQQAGRGRFGRTWESPRGASLLMSIVVVDSAQELRGEELGLIASVATVDGVCDATNVPVSIKWPNDLFVGERKIGGILVEAKQLKGSAITYVIGIGVNCLQQEGHFQGDLRSSATSLELECKDPIDRTAILQALLERADGWLAEPNQWPYDDLRAAWKTRSSSIGRRVCLREQGRLFSGTIVDLDPAAAIVVQLDVGGVRAFNAAETTVESIETIDRED